MHLITRWYEKDFQSRCKVTFILLEKILFTVLLTYQSLSDKPDLHDVFKVCMY